MTMRTNTCYVLDASAVGTDELLCELHKISSSGSKVILTHITIDELVKLQNFQNSDYTSRYARHILAMAAYNPEMFECIRIDETIGTPDECIVKYCADNKEHIVLLTADKAMALTARSYGVKTTYLRHGEKLCPRKIKPSSSGLINLYMVKKVGYKYFISCYLTYDKAIKLIKRDGSEFLEGIHEINIGDNVYISKNKDEYFTFAHYKIVSLEEHHNAKLVYHTRITSRDDIKNMPTPYKSFARDFKRETYINI